MIESESKNPSKDKLPHQFELIVSTHQGLEEVLAEEVRKLGGSEVELITRGVRCKGDLGFVYKCNLALRTALRVLLVLKRFNFRDNAGFYEACKAIAWEEWMENTQLLSVKSIENQSIFNNTMFLAQLTKDAIVDRLREKTGKRPYVHASKADIYIHTHVYKHTATISIDSSGESLHVRGYKQATAPAPLNEVLAAGLLQFMHWHPALPLYDPMSGSGTFSIEAALMARQVPPGIFRKKHAFKQWQNFEGSLFEKIVDALCERIVDVPLQIFACDKAITAVDAVCENAAFAELDDCIQPVKSDFFRSKPQTAHGMIMLNPPYGERLSLESVEKFYQELGSVLKHQYAGFQAGVLVSDQVAMHAIGLKPKRKWMVFNGSIECRFLQYELYQGSKKKQQ